MKIYICGAETLTVPNLDGNGVEVQEPNTARFHLVMKFIAYEMKALHDGGQFTSLAFDSGSQITCILPRILLPSAPLQVALANALSVFNPDLVYIIGGGIAPDATMATALATFEQAVLAAGKLLRDAGNIN